MTIFKPLSPALVRRLLQGVEDELTPLAEARMRQIKQAPCPRCGSAMHPRMNAKHPFAPGDVLPRMHAECVECGFAFDHNSGLVVSAGSASKIQDPYPIIKPEGSDPAPRR